MKKYRSARLGPGHEKAARRAVGKRDGYNRRQVAQKCEKGQKGLSHTEAKNEIKAVAFREVMRKELASLAAERYGCSTTDLARLLLIAEDKYNIMSIVVDLMESFGIEYEDFMRALKEIANEDASKD